MKKNIWLFAFSVVVSAFILSGCASDNDIAETISTTNPTAPHPNTTEPAKLEAVEPLDGLDKWSLWSNGTQLRGANIYQRNVIPEIDGTEFIGPGPVGPPYTQEDIDHLAEMGANYVNISHPGLFTDTPPYVLDEGAQANLDRLLEMIARADMFAVITFRSGPGRSEYSILRDGVGVWYDESYLIENVWTDQDAQDAWAEMWAYTAERYRENPIVVGYDLMCEPNSNAIFDIWDPEEFQSQYGGTLYDWNQMYPAIVDAIREVDPDTPILIGGNGYGLPGWLPYLQILPDPYIVYTAHQYDPHPLTHQELDQNGEVENAYPGEFDADYNGQPELIDADWLANWLVEIADFQAENQIIIAINEYGIMRWIPGAAEFVRVETDIFETYGWNYAIWMWYPSWEPLAEGDNSFNIRLGSDPNNLDDLPASDLLDVITDFWSQNAIRPSSLRRE